MTRDQWRVALLLFFSGFCALIYQTVWMRQFRLVFGASTAATAAVLAIFMAGLGLGSALLGPKADRKERPLGYYGNLELLIAVSAGASLVLIAVIARIYFALGGSVTLGTGGATIVRLLLSTLVLAVPTILMGGTLPAAARAVQTESDSGRRAVSLLYGINTLGAVAGTLLATFVLLEHLGNRSTLLGAVAINLLVGIIARAMSRELPLQPIHQPEISPVEVGDEPTTDTMPQRAVYVAAAVVGFAFLLMELVWYRMLSPLLGGTSYMFGLILAIALLGIGLGGAAYALLRRRVATAGGFALTCTFEALAIAIPFALGDRLAILANSLRSLGVTGFAGHVIGWTIVTSIVVLPAAFIAGIQFPLLISLLGRGRRNLGREIGTAYEWNTGGAIAGSLAGGFGLLPLLSATGSWRLVVALLTGLGLVTVFFSFRARARAISWFAIAASATAIAAVFAIGPTAVWRHSGIGAARAPQPTTRNDLISWMNAQRMSVLWDADGRESSVALARANDLAFIVNGKTDGASRGDAPTQVMAGLIGAMLHPHPKTSLVVGLGTGSSAGWLARIPSMERVDVVELEPVVLDVARACTAVNAGAMTNPRVHIQIADAREVLLATPRRYDVIASEPSNPYRAGIASLFTKEFYEASAGRLNRGGVIVQWMQMYAIDTSTVRTIYATMTSVFPYVETWWTTRGDAVLVGSREPIVHDIDRLRTLLRTEPYRTAASKAWRVDDAEAFMAHMAANDRFALLAAAEASDLNTDDRPVIEFGFARSLDGSANGLQQLVATSARFGTLLPRHMKGALDIGGVAIDRDAGLPQQVSIVNPTNTHDLALRAMQLATEGNAEAEALAARLRKHEASEADAVLGRLRFVQRRYSEAARHLVLSFAAMRTSPWALPEVGREAVDTALSLTAADPRHARVIHDQLTKPFAAYQQDRTRRYARILVAQRAFGCGPETIVALRDVEPDPIWSGDILSIRAACYAQARLGDLAESAEEDLFEFAASQPTPLITQEAAAAPR